MDHSNLGFLFFFLFSFFICAAAYSSSYSSNNTHTRCSLIQTRALLLFKQNLFSYNYGDNNDFYYDNCHDWLGSNYYPIMMNWNTSIDCCNWDGVTCDHFTGDVIALDLSCGMLRGTIHPNSTLFNLPHLQRLNLAFNDLTGSQLPREIGRFSNSLTHLNISDSGFTGQVPKDITLLRKLVSLDLSYNFYDSRLEPHVFYYLLHNSTSLEELSFNGVNHSSILPSYLNISSSLKSLHLSSTSLQGKLPDNIFNLPYLEELDLSSNDFLTGPFPKVNNSINIPLKWLDLSFTNLPVPDPISHLNSLNTLYLNYNGLMGPLPRSLVNLRHLTTLSLSGNKLNGTLPSWLFTLPPLESIDLSYNMFSGSLPSELFNHRSLKELSLSGNQFVGEIDIQAFWKLINLTSLDLSFNNFTGVWELDTLLSSLTNITELGLSYSGLSVVTNNDTHYVNPNFSGLGLASCKLKVFPKSLRAMKMLQGLDLSNNEIRGNIPDWAGEIGGKQLQFLNLSHNFITSLPQFHWDGLLVLDLQSNLIQGSFPPSICNMSGLQYMDMFDNRFGGVIPQCLGNMSSSVSMVDLSNNQFRGTIPNAWDDCEQLEELILNGNHLEGEVPSGLSKCEWLEVLDLGNNHLNGTFPHWSAHLPHLQVLVLKSNKLHGPINESSSSMIELMFQNLRVLDLSHNNFVGHLPQKYFHNFNSMKDVVRKGTTPQYLRTNFKFYSITLEVKGLELPFPKFPDDYTIIDLSSNMFEGEIPSVIGSLNSLIVLNLSHNHLNGRIPNALGNLSEMESLDLSCNRLTGQIPQSLAMITTLEVLNLSQNHLVGRIPSGTQFSTFGTSFGGNPGLCGFPLPTHCEQASTTQLEVDEDEESGFTWKVVMLGYGCGTPLGLVLGYLMLSTGRPKWFNAIADELEHMVQRRQTKR